MPGSCCGRPIAKIIKVGNSEAGIAGLETALTNVYTSGIKDEEQIQAALLRSVRQLGNFIPASVESDYKSALLWEYREFVRHEQNK